MQELTVPQAFGSDAKIHPEPYAKYPDDERRTNSRARVREWLEEGQLTESTVLTQHPPTR